MKICVGGLAVIPGTRASNTPFYSELISKPKLEKFTAIIHAVQTVPSSASPIIKLIKSLWKSTYWNVLIFKDKVGCVCPMVIVSTAPCRMTINSQVDIILKQIKSGQVIILWACEHPQPGDGRWPEAPEGKSFTILTDHELKMTNRLYPYHEIKYDAVLSLDNDVTLHQEEIDFSFTVWQTFPHRIVGFPARVSFSLQLNRQDLSTIPARLQFPVGYFLYRPWNHKMLQNLSSRYLRKILATHVL